MPLEPAKTVSIPNGGRILLVRGQQVMLDSDLAGIFMVTTSQLNQALKRNQNRFPTSFAFQLERQEFAGLLSQSVIAKPARGGRQTPPWVFTEHGVIMLACVLNSDVAVQASIRVVQAFIWMREQLTANQSLAKKLTELEGRLDGHDEDLQKLFGAIRRMLEAPSEETPKKEMGFHIREQAPPYRVRTIKR